MALQSFLLIFSIATVSIHESLAFENVTEADSSPDANSTCYSFILLGATGDLAKREIYPALYRLYRDNLLPKDTKIFGYALEQHSVTFLRRNSELYIKVKRGEKELYDKFWQLNSYVGGTDGGLSDYETIDKAVEAFENGRKGTRIFYLALPPSAFKNATLNIKAAAMAKNGSTRVVIEKPCYDIEGSQRLSEHLEAIFSEDQIYRMDHYLGYEMVLNLYALRFGNRIFEPAWNKENVAAVKINFAEDTGIEGRGSYFDDAGIIGSVMQNHLLQVMSLIAMEKPKSDPARDNIRDAVVQMLRDTQIMDLRDVVLGQYVANNPKAKVGYRDDPTVPDDSITPTFALTVLQVNNERWKGVPFIVRAGIGLNETQTQIIVQFKNVTDDNFATQPMRNELIINLKNPQALQVKLSLKEPGFSNNLQGIDVNFNYDQANKDVKLPEPYERLILDVFRGSQLNFVRNDELREGWRIFSPILWLSKQFKIQPKKYKFGSAGPKEADELERKYNFLNQI